MTDIIGYCLSSVIALGIMFIGARFAFAPHAAAAAYGVSVGRDPRWEAYLSVKAVRDIACGLFTAILILNRSAHLLGWFMLAATIIPCGRCNRSATWRDKGRRVRHPRRDRRDHADRQRPLAGELRLRSAIDWARTPPAGSGRCATGRIWPMCDRRRDWQRAWKGIGLESRSRNRRRVLAIFG